MSAAIARAETAERELAALRRRVEEAAREDATEVATIRAAVAFPEVVKSYDAASVLHVLRALDHARAAAGELRGMLREARSVLMTIHDRAPGEHGAAVRLLAFAFWNRPDIIAACKETRE